VSFRCCCCCGCRVIPQTNPCEAGGEMKTRRPLSRLDLHLIRVPARHAFERAHVVMRLADGSIRASCVCIPHFFREGPVVIDGA
jgi:hypothetical protein